MVDEEYRKRLDDQGVNGIWILLGAPFLIMGSLLAMTASEPVSFLSLGLTRLVGLLGTGFFGYAFLQHLDKMHGIKIPIFKILMAHLLLFLAIIFDVLDFREETAGLLNNFGFDNEFTEFIRNPDRFVDEYYANEFANLSCDDLKSHEGEILKNRLGGEFEILIVSGGIEISRDENEIICEADSIINPSGESKLRIRYANQNGEFFYQINEI